jgi:Family of unknown function (DUF6518)
VHSVAISPTTTEEATSRVLAVPVAARVAVVAVVGLAVGAATSILQKYLHSPWDSLVNAASPWLTPMFALGMLWRRSWPAALAGVGTGVAELAGYYLTAAARGYSASHAILLFWTVCAIVGGPAFGAAGWLWWRGTRRLSSLGAAALPAAFLAEAAEAYAWRLHYYSSAVLFAGIGIVVFALTGLRGRQHGRAARWLLAAFPVGVAAELILDLIYNQSF